MFWWSWQTWRHLVEHKMMVHIFGTTSSPSVATFVLQKCTTDFAEEFGPDKAQTVRTNFYVDHCLKSAPDEDTAITLCAELRSMLAKGRFRLTKWSSNSRKLLNSIPEDKRAQGFQDLDLDDVVHGESIGYPVVCRIRSVQVQDQPQRLVTQ